MGYLADCDSYSRMYVYMMRCAHLGCWDDVETQLYCCCIDYGLKEFFLNMMLCDDLLLVCQPLSPFGRL